MRRLLSVSSRSEVRPCLELMLAAEVDSFAVVGGELKNQSRAARTDCQAGRSSEERHMLQLQLQLQARGENLLCVDKSLAGQSEAVGKGGGVL
jgi:hypothetical protein